MVDGCAYINDWLVLVDGKVPSVIGPFLTALFLHTFSHCSMLLDRSLDYYGDEAILPLAECSPRGASGAPPSPESMPAQSPEESLLALLASFADRPYPLNQLDAMATNDLVRYVTALVAAPAEVRERLWAFAVHGHLQLDDDDNASGDGCRVANDRDDCGSAPDPPPASVAASVAFHRIDGASLTLLSEEDVRSCFHLNTPRECATTLAWFDVLVRCLGPSRAPHAGPDSPMRNGERPHIPSASSATAEHGDFGHQQSSPSEGRAATNDDDDGPSGADFTFIEEALKQLRESWATTKEVAAVEQNQARVGKRLLTFRKPSRGPQTVVVY